jgi:hypothetical protein
VQAPEVAAAASREAEVEAATLLRMAALGFDVARVREALRCDARNHFTTTFRLLAQKSA